MTKLWSLLAIGAAIFFVPDRVDAQQAPLAIGLSLAAQQNVPQAAQRAEAEVESAVRRFRIGLQGGVGLDPEIIDVGVHATIGPIFRRNVQFRPVLELGLGEVTTLLGVNLDVLWSFGGLDRDTPWVPYLGAGPNFGLSHRGFENEDEDNIDVDDDGDSRFDFSDTDFNGGMNFIVGMRKPSGVFFEMKATAWGVSNIRLLAGFNF